MNKPTDEEFEDWQMIPWMVGLGLRLEKEDGHEPREIQQIISLLRQLDGDKMVGWAMPHWDGMVFSRAMFEDDIGKPAMLIVYDREGSEDE